MHRIERLLLYPTLALLVAAVFFGLGTVTADAPADAAFGTLTVRQVKVVGPDGAVLAVLGSDEDGGLLQITSHAEKGVGGIRLETYEGAGRAVARGSGGKDVAFFGTDGDTLHGLLALKRVNGDRSVDLSANDRGGYAKFYEMKGNAVAFAGTASDTGRGLFVHWNVEGVRCGEISSNAKGGYVATQGIAGKQTTYLGAATDSGVGLLGLHRADGVRALFAFAGEEGGSVRVLKPDGSEAINATASPQGGKITLTDAVGTVVLPLRK